MIILACFIVSERAGKAGTGGAAGPQLCAPSPHQGTVLGAGLLQLCSRQKGWAKGHGAGCRGARGCEGPTHPWRFLPAGPSAALP